MSTNELNGDALVARPATLSMRSLCRRAAVGFVILFTGTLILVWLYDISIKAIASTPPANVGSGAVGIPAIPPVTVLRSRHADNR